MNIPQLTFTRFFAAICIVILHFGMVVNPFNQPKVLPFICKLDSLVSYFFVLSGFILVVSNSGPEKSAAQLNKKKFWINRFARIYPVYLVALIAVILLVSKSTDFIGYFGWNKIAVNHILMIQAWNPDYVIYYNYPAWSLSVELLFYISFPFLFFMLDKCSWKLLLTISVLGWFLNIIALVFMVENEVGDKFKYYFPLFHFSTFIAGVSAGLIFCKNFEFVKK